MQGRAGAAGPALCAAAGCASVPLLRVSGVVALALALAALLVGVVLAAERRPAEERLAALLGVVGGLATVGLLGLPVLLQD